MLACIQMNQVLRNRVLLFQHAHVVNNLIGVGGKIAAVEIGLSAAGCGTFWICPCDFRLRISLLLKPPYHVGKGAFHLLL